MKFAVAACCALAVALAPAAATTAIQLRGQGKDEPGPRLPIGEGAYQSGKAVAQRTTDSRKDCEKSKWADCYKTKGDYVDTHAKIKEAPKVQSAPAKSSASSKSVLVAAVAALVAGSAQALS
eukprot:TRINITY_DN992_c0_g3_i2.p1 TRINITY_DN992_c0_g3~~TRINITY_DN992_c0_g3_i2.p1  ORF type:complete len:143 (+),score=30.23 TRINITY_DN992_c0_g3_i2:66-431(+)